MARTHGLTDEQVEEEIARLSKSPLVALARRERQVRNKRRIYLYHLRELEKKGAALAEAGITADVLKAFVEASTYAED